MTTTRPEHREPTISDDEIESVVAAGRSLAGELHSVRSAGDIAFTWDYDRSRDALSRLYEKAKSSQWNGSTDLPWHLEVDQERLARAMADTPATQRFKEAAARHGSEVARWDDAQWLRFEVENQNGMLSQFLHGEQGALLCTGKLVEQVPWIDAKYYAATQVMDEARHVEVFAKYLDEKLSGHYPLNTHLGMLLEDIIEDSRWDMTYLGMQIMVEGLALAAFGFIHSMTEEPLLKKMLRYVMSDEARHVAFGVLSLKEYYEGLSDAELQIMAQEAGHDLEFFGRILDYAKENGRRIVLNMRMFEEMFNCQAGEEGLSALYELYPDSALWGDARVWLAALESEDESAIAYLNEVGTRPELLEGVPFERYVSESGLDESILEALGVEAAE